MIIGRSGFVAGKSVPHEDRTGTAKDPASSRQRFAKVEIAKAKAQWMESVQTAASGTGCQRATEKARISGTSAAKRKRKTLKRASWLPGMWS